MIVTANKYTVQTLVIAGYFCEGLATRNQKDPLRRERRRRSLGSEMNFPLSAAVVSEPNPYQCPIEEKGGANKGKKD